MSGQRSGESFLQSRGYGAEFQAGLGDLKNAGHLCLPFPSVARLFPTERLAKCAHSGTEAAGLMGRKRVTCLCHETESRRIAPFFRRFLVRDGFDVRRDISCAGMAATQSA